MDPYNVTWPQGEDLTFPLIYKEGPAGAQVAVDLTGYSVRMDLVTMTGQRIYTFNSNDIADVDPVAAGAQPDTNKEAVLGTDGSINISIPRSLTLPGGVVYDLLVATPPVEILSYDIFLRRPNTKQFKILRGTVTVERSHTLWL